MNPPVPINRAKPLPPELAKKLPVNIDAEKRILGAILMDNRALVAALKAGLLESHFFYSHHQNIFRCMSHLALEDRTIDLVTLTEEARNQQKLEACGGAPYIAQLADGMPKLSPIADYVAIVIDKALRRQIVYAAYAMEERAFEEDDSKPAEILAGASAAFAAIAETTKEENPIVVVSYKELLTLELPKADPVIEPLVTRGGTFMIFSWSGWGKSWIATEMAFRVAHGVPEIFNGHSGRGGHWPIFGPMRTLYLYGEMPGEKIRERLTLIAKQHNSNADFEGLAVVSKDFQRIARAPRCAQSWLPGIGQERDRRRVEDLLFGGGYQFLVLDNISTLWSVAREEESMQVATLKDWFISLNSRGITICFLQHAGKGGDFLGDSAQVHILDSYLKLEHPPDYKKSQGLRVVIEIKKNRYELRDPTWGIPFEAQLTTSAERGAEWLTRTATSAQKKIAFELFSNGAPVTEVIKHLSGVSRPSAYRWHQEWKEHRTAE